MKIAILTSGRLPVPAVLGGAVENLIDFYLEYNNVHHLYDITVYSIKHDKIVKPDTECNHYCYIDMKSIVARIAKKIYSKFNKSAYYDSEIEYYLYKSLRHLKRQNYDCVILENRPGYAMAVKKVTNSPIILHLHNDLLNKDTFCGEQICGCLSNVISISNYVKRCVETLGMKVPVETVYNGIDLKRFHVELGHHVLKREDLNLSDDDFVVVFSGRLTKEKGIKELLQAFMLLTEYPSIKLMIMGSVFYGDKTKAATPFLLELQNLADEMSGKVVFTGFVPYNDIASYLRMADIAVVPSVWEEPLGLTALEAMATALPIIITKSGGLPEVVNDCSVIIPIDDEMPRNIANSIIELYSNLELRKQMADKAYTQSKKYGKEVYALNFFSQLTSHKFPYHSENGKNQ